MNYARHEHCCVHMGVTVPQTCTNGLCRVQVSASKCLGSLVEITTFENAKGATLSPKRGKYMCDRWHTDLREGRGNGQGGEKGLGEGTTAGVQVAVGAELDSLWGGNPKGPRRLARGLCPLLQHIVLERVLGGMRFP